MRGAITGYIDVAQLTLYAFWLFFAGLIFYLRREDKREGYPLRSERSGRIVVQGLPEVPAPKTFLLPHGGVALAPRPAEEMAPINARPSATWMGAPLVPLGNPLTDAVGPAAYAMRSDMPEATLEGDPRIVPLRVEPLFFVAPEDPDPRGMPVFGADRVQAGVVSEVWVDRSDYLARYLEVTLDGVAGGRSVLLPMNLLKVQGPQRRIRVKSITAAQFAGVPGHAHPDQVTMREEDRIMGYYGGGTLYATPNRSEPLL